MATIRVERTAVGPYFLGLLGFDHLQLVFDPGTSKQDDWFVIEGVRDNTNAGPVLGVQGADGGLTLARANAAARTDLVGRIGTPEARGSTIIAAGRKATRLWTEMAREAEEIDRQRLPYVAIGAPGAGSHACNSSSVVATLLHRAGFHTTSCLPHSARMIPGFDTVIARAVPSRFETGSRPVRPRECWPSAARRGNVPATDRRYASDALCFASSY